MVFQYGQSSEYKWAHAKAESEWHFTHWAVQTYLNKQESNYWQDYFEGEYSNLQSKLFVSSDLSDDGFAVTLYSISHS